MHSSAANVYDSPLAIIRFLELSANEQEDIRALTLISLSNMLLLFSFSKKTATEISVLRRADLVCRIHAAVWEGIAID